MARLRLGGMRKRTNSRSCMLQSWALQYSRRVCLHISSLYTYCFQICTRSQHNNHELTGCCLRAASRFFCYMGVIHATYNH